VDTKSFLIQKTSLARDALVIIHDDLWNCDVLATLKVSEFDCCHEKIFVRRASYLDTVGVNNGIVYHFLMVSERDEDQPVSIILCVSIHQWMESTSGDSGFKFPARVLRIYIP
jgi:hypothetical protein